jgi:hypothetical protein
LNALPWRWAVTVTILVELWDQYRNWLDNPPASIESSLAENAILEVNLELQEVGPPHGDGRSGTLPPNPTHNNDVAGTGPCMRPPESEVRSCRPRLTPDMMQRLRSSAGGMRFRFPSYVRRSTVMVLGSRVDHRPSHGATSSVAVAANAE